MLNFLLRLIFFVLLILSTFSSSFPQTGASVTGISRAFNPAISVNGLFLGAYVSDREKEEELSTGMRVQEVEIRLSSFIDPHVRADLLFAVEGTEGIEIEEGYVTTVGLPGNLGLKGGKIFGEFGKHNLLHTHLFPFVDNPLVNERIFGEEGLNDVGLSLSYLFPVSWYSELTLQFLNGDNEEIFNSPDDNDLAYLGHFKNFWDLSESSTLEIGGSYAGGSNDSKKGLSQVVGADLRIKWKPLRRAVYKSITWQTEYIYLRKSDDDDNVDEVGGLYSLLQYQFSRRWWIEGRYDAFGLPERKDEKRIHRGSLLLAFVPSGFSALRIQYNRLREEDKNVNELMIQYNFTIGSHPAHKY